MNKTTIIVGFVGLVLIVGVGIHFANKGHCVRFRAGSFGTDVNC